MGTVVMEPLPARFTRPPATLALGTLGALLRPVGGRSKPNKNEIPKMKFGKDININAPHYNSSNVRGIPCNSQSASPWMSYHCSPNTLNTRLRRYVSQLGSSTQFWGLIWTGRFVVARPLKGSSTTTCTTNKVAPSLKRFKRIMLPWHLVA